jgi:hypothetical protein
MVMLKLFAGALTLVLNTVFGKNTFIYLGAPKTVTEIEVNCRQVVREASDRVKKVELTEEESGNIYNLLLELVTKGHQFDQAHRFQKIHDSLNSRIKKHTDTAQTCAFLSRWDIANLEKDDYYQAVGRINEALEEYFAVSNRHMQTLLAVCIEEQTARIQRENPTMNLMDPPGPLDGPPPMMIPGGGVGDA